MMILYSPLTTVFWNHPDDKSITSEAKCHFKIFLKSFQHISSERWVAVFFPLAWGDIKTTATRKWLGPVESFVRPSISTAQYNLYRAAAAAVIYTNPFFGIYCKVRDEAQQHKRYIFLPYSPIYKFLHGSLRTDCWVFCCVDQKKTKKKKRLSKVNRAVFWLNYKSSAVVDLSLLQSLVYNMYRPIFISIQPVVPFIEKGLFPGPSSFFLKNGASLFGWTASSGWRVCCWWRWLYKGRCSILHIIGCEL